MFSGGNTARNISLSFVSGLEFTQSASLVRIIEAQGNLDGCLHRFCGRFTNSEEASATLEAGGSFHKSCGSFRRGGRSIHTSFRVSIHRFQGCCLLLPWTLLPSIGIMKPKHQLDDAHADHTNIYSNLIAAAGENVGANIPNTTNTRNHLLVLSLGPKPPLSSHPRLNRTSVVSLWARLPLKNGHASRIAYWAKINGLVQSHTQPWLSASPDNTVRLTRRKYHRGM